MGLWVNNKGTDWRCMFDPIKALFASSCSKKGIKDAAAETIWTFEIKIKSTSNGLTVKKSCLYRTGIEFADK